MSWRLETVSGKVKMYFNTLSEAKQYAEEAFKGEYVHFIDWKGETAVYLTPERIRTYNIIQDNND